MNNLNRESSASDRDLWQAFLAGDREAFARLFHLYSDANIERGFLMNKLLSCRYNMDTNRVEARFEDGTTVAIDCIAVEDEYGNTPAQRAELDWLLYNKPLEYAQMVLRGEMEHYLSLGCDHGRLED